MAYPFFSQEWAVAYGEKLRANEAYRKAAATWEWPMVLRVTKDPRYGLEEDQAVYLDLYRGECREARAATPEDLESAPYVVSADAYTWKQIVDGKLEPIGGIVRGKLKLTRGNLLKLATYVQAARELVNTATQVETAFPEGLA